MGENNLRNDLGATPPGRKNSSLFNRNILSCNLQFAHNFVKLLLQKDMPYMVTITPTKTYALYGYYIHVLEAKFLYLV